MVNTILTSDLLNILQKVSTSQEWAEILSSKVETACFYKKSDYLEPNEFLKYFDDPSHFGSYIYNVKDQSNEDSRSRKWTKIPLSKLIQPLLDEHTKLKQLLKQTVDKEEKLRYSNEEQFYKLLINQTFGIFASYYYTISNVLLANVLTARARANIIWLA